MIAANAWQTKLNKNELRLVCRSSRAELKLTMPFKGFKSYQDSYPVSATGQADRQAGGAAGAKAN